MCTAPTLALADFWELPPIRYSETLPNNKLTELANHWNHSPSALDGKTPLERLRIILAALKIPESSQILVFSKTSKQNQLIHPQQPRALYFSHDTYCGYVPGGALEVASQDPQLGTVFHLIDLGNPTQTIHIERDTSDCLSCHATGRTEHVPGLLIRSVYPDAAGHPVLSKGSGVITHETPIEERWGGYYVTGSISLPHLGNQTYSNARDSEPAVHSWKNLSGKINTAPYPRNTSDIVALMVLEHQCHAHNLLTAASMNYKRAYHLGKALDPEADPDLGSAGRVADHAAAQIVSWFLFKNEADQGVDGVEGDPEFQERFEASVPHTADGRSLADFELNRRLFKHRCSYMIYSAAFQTLPPRVKSRVIAGLKNVLESTTTADEFPNMKLTERHRTAKILRETGIF
jgi:hypothetical protein